MYIPHLQIIGIQKLFAVDVTRTHMTELGYFLLTINS